MTAAYIDASAAVKLVIAEAESAALSRELVRFDEWVSAAIVITEVVRATRRWATAIGLRPGEVDRQLARADMVTRRLALIDVDIPGLRRAGETDPVSLTSLDAIHLSSAIAVLGDIAAFITYDRRLGKAAESAGFTVLSPS